MTFSAIFFLLIITIPLLSDKATSADNSTEQWDLIEDICTQINRNLSHSKEYVLSIMKRMDDNDSHVAMQAITVSLY